MTGFHKLYHRKTYALHCFQLILEFKGLVFGRQDVSRWDVLKGLVSDWRLEGAKYNVSESSLSSFMQREYAHATECGLNKAVQRLDSSGSRSL